MYVSYFVFILFNKIYIKKSDDRTLTESKELFRDQQIVNSTLRLVASMFYIVLSLPSKLPRSQNLPRDSLP